MTPLQRKVFEQLVEAACAGSRCPTIFELGKGGRNVSGLARKGLIRSEIYAHNYRVIEIRAGEHTGKRTAEDPRGGKPYRILDKNGDRWLSRPKEQGPVVIRHADHSADRDRPVSAVTLQKLSFLEGEEL